MKHVQKIRVGYIRPSRLHPEGPQRELMDAAKVDKCYIEGDGPGLRELLRALSGREYVVCVATLGRLGKTRDVLREVMQHIIDAGSIIQELETGREIASTREAAAAAMSLEAAAELAGDARALSNRHAREYGKLGGDASAAAKRERLTADRMPIVQAEKIWNRPGLMTNADRLLLMTGWSLHQAYRELDKRGVAIGRPKRKT